MDTDTVNKTKLSSMMISPTFTWCFLMPSIHILSLISNILCIIVFSSNVFIKKPIAIYFICLLISDSITLFIGYIEMIDRESNMIDKSSLLCMFNERIIHKLTDFVYNFMEKYCVQWMLYKVLWTRASTIVLAILSVQRSRTFFSLSYHETRAYAFCACIFSIIMALTLTFLEWLGVEYKRIHDSNIYLEIYQSIMNKTTSKEVYLTSLNENYNQSLISYPCLMESFNLTLFPVSIAQLNCSSNDIKSQFHELTKSLLSQGDVESTAKMLTDIVSNDYNLSNESLLKQQYNLAKTSDFIPKLFESRTCQIGINYLFWLKTFNFLHSVSFSFNRHALAIFFGNAFPSFIVVLANLLSIKAIFFSKSLQYLKQSARKNRRKRRFQSDLRAFLVILIESFSIIMISWGVPIFLTMYHCHTLYVVTISTCPKIKDYLALFLFTDLFNSSTNCFLYSLSGKLFRRKFIALCKGILTCGRGTLWNRHPRPVTRTSHALDRQLSNNPSLNALNNHHNNNSHNNNVSRPSLTSASCINSEQASFSKKSNQTSKADNALKIETSANKIIRSISNEASLTTPRISNEPTLEKYSSSDVESEKIRRTNHPRMRPRSRSLKAYFIGKVRSFSSTSSTNEKTLPLKSPSNILSFNKRKHSSKTKKSKSKSLKQPRTTDLSASSSSTTRSSNYGSQQKFALNYNYALSRLVLNKTIENSSTVRETDSENCSNV